MAFSGGLHKNGLGGRKKDVRSGLFHTGHCKKHHGSFTSYYEVLKNVIELTLTHKEAMQAVGMKRNTRIGQAICKIIPDNPSRHRVLPILDLQQRPDRCTSAWPRLLTFP